MQRLGPQKESIKHFGNWAVFMRWSGVWLCTRDGWLKADLQRVGFTLHNSSLVLICDAKTWSPKKSIKHFGNWTVFMRWSGVWLCTRDGWLKADLQRVGFTLHNSSLVLICDAKTWSPKKSIKHFGNWTVFMRWSGVWLCTRDGWLKADLQRSWFHPTQLFLSLYLWCKDLVPKKRV